MEIQVSMLIEEDVKIHIFSCFNVKTNSFGVRAHSLPLQITILIIIFPRKSNVNQNKFQMFFLHLFNRTNIVK